MDFNLFHVNYEYRPTIGAAIQFEKATKKCFQSTCVAYYNMYIKCRTSSLSLNDTVENLATIMTMDHAIDFLFALAKTENSQVSRAEIADGVFHSNVIGDIESEDSAPWPIVLSNVALACIEEINEQKTKKRNRD